jgi:hypothetical protein
MADKPDELEARPLAVGNVFSDFIFKKNYLFCVSSFYFI